MDDVAGLLGMSKKTIYHYFDSKQEMLLGMVDYIFDNIKMSEHEIVENEDLTTIEKIRSILGVLPEGYKEIDFNQLYLLQEKFPEVYNRVQQRLENGWEMTLGLMQQGVEEEVIRPVNLSIFKMMMEASLEQFFGRDILVQNHMTYQQGLASVVDILMNGIEQ